jgi:hypothetical protein
MATGDSFTIPTLTDGTTYYSLRTTLDGLDYQLDLDWSPREDRWYLTLRDSQGELLMGATKLVQNIPLLRYRRHIAGTPAGELVVSTLGTDDSPPTRLELGPDGRCQLCYFEA